MRLKDYAKTLYEVNQDNKCYCIISASVIDQKLQIHQIDFEQWEYNRRTGQVESIDCLDEENTKKFCEHYRILHRPILSESLSENLEPMASIFSYPTSESSVMTIT